MKLKKFVPIIQNSLVYPVIYDADRRVLRCAPHLPVPREKSVILNLLASPPGEPAGISACRHAGWLVA